MSRKSVQCIAAVSVMGMSWLAPTAVEAQSPTGPDLQITAILVATSPGPFGPGPLQFTVGIRNAGDVASAATTLRYYRSSDATISTSDTQVGTEAVAEVAPSDTISAGSEVNGPSEPGTYYYGACVDAVTGESDTTNNCSGSLTVTVEEPAPDLVVVSPSVDGSRQAVGATFTLSITVRNDGNGDSPATTLRNYRSTDATISTADTEEGSQTLAGLAASESRSEFAGLTAPSTPGTYYYGRVRGRGDRRIRHHQQLLGRRAGFGGGACAGLGCAGAKRERQQPGDGRDVPANSDGAQPGRESVGGDNDAVLPLDGRDDYDIRHIGGHGTGSGAWHFARHWENDFSDGAIDGWHVLLRRLRRRGRRGVRHDEQLLKCRVGHCVGAAAASTTAADQTRTSWWSRPRSTRAARPRERRSRSRQR